MNRVMPTELTSLEAVRQAMAEFENLGRDAFLAKYGFGLAKRRPSTESH
jgi:hypothetical protein